MPNLGRLKSMGLKGKIIMLPLLGILALVLVTGVDWYLRIEKNKQAAIGKTSDSISMSVIDLLRLEEKYLREQDQDLVFKIKELRKKLQEEARALTEASNDKKILAKLGELQKTFKEHEKLFSEMVKQLSLTNKARADLSKTFRRANESLVEIIQGINMKEANLNMEGEVLDSVYAAARNEVKDLSAFGNKYMMALYELISNQNEKAYKKTMAGLSKSLALGLKNTGTVFSSLDSDEFVSKWTQAKAELAGLASPEKAFFAHWKEVKGNLPHLRASAQHMEDLLKQVSGFTKTAMKKQDQIGTWVAVLSSAITILGLMLFGLAISRSVGRSVGNIAETLREGAEQVASAAQQVSSSSQTLAEGASEQASAVEETSSGLEEMSSVTNQNAQNTGQANSLMKETTSVVAEASDAMSEMIKSMEEVSSASHETQKIIKDIDEVAFQTNLLALNAAVEAARAGEAGAGFAVVADEVRSLAMRAAEAAKNTAALIEKTISKVNVGTELVNKTNDSFLHVEEKSNKVALLITEVTEASKEQAEGIQQINRAIEEMDKVIQQNAANAEESASASEEMSAQAEQMKAVVHELMRIVEGGKAGTTRHHKEHSQVHEASDNAESMRLRKAEAPIGTFTNPAPEKVIPLDDDEDFEEF